MAKKIKQPLIIPTWHFLCQHVAYLLAFGFGSGLSKWAPGTMGSLIALPSYWVLTLFLSPRLILLATIVLFLVGIWAADKTSHALGVDDYGGIVIDEIVAMWLVLIIAPQTGVGMLIAFILFRFFDIVKPWPIRWFERHIAGGLGIMIDDIIAALFAIIILFIWQSY